MSGDEDTELRDLIVQTLENNGVIGKIKAELRASVFLALEDEGSFRDKIPLVNKKLSDFLLTTDGKIAVSLVHEFLEYFNLNFSLAVFDPEVTSTSGFMSRKELCDHLQLDPLDFQSPLISHLCKLKKTVSEPTFSTPVHNQANDLINAGVSVANKVAESSTGKLLDNFDIKENDKGHNFDSFFDEPVPPSPIVNLYGREKNPSEIIKQDISINQKNLKDDNELSSFESYLKSTKQTSDNDIKFEKNENNFEDKLQEKKESSSFAKKAENVSFLRDLPPLNPRAPVESDWLLNKSQKKTLPSLKRNDSDEKDKLEEEISVNSELSSKSSVKSMEKPKSDISDISEQSIEEELEDDVSGVDDLLSSISVGEDSTSDHTVSTVSVAGYDYIEKCHPKKK